MVLFNYATKEITAKIVYYGPGLWRQDDDLQFVYDSAAVEQQKQDAFAGDEDRPHSLLRLPPSRPRQRSAACAQSCSSTPCPAGLLQLTRQTRAQGADGIVFRADSQDHAIDANLESLQNSRTTLKRQGVRIREIPLVCNSTSAIFPTRCGRRSGG